MVKTASNFLDLIAIRRGTHQDEYHSICHAEKLGNAADIAYGGCVAAMAMNAAHASLLSSRNDAQRLVVYSMVGHYLGPMQCDRKIILRLQRLRDTKTFTTRHIVASQLTDNGSERQGFSATIDFMVLEKENSNELLPFGRYSLAPVSNYPPADSIEPLEVKAQEHIANGELNEDLWVFVDTTMRALHHKVTISMEVPGTIHHANLIGLLPHLETPHAKLSLPDRLTADWFKAKDTLSEGASALDDRLPISSAAANASYLAFAMDASLSFVPLTFSNLSLMDADACSSLDFALRFVDPNPNLDEFHLREIQTLAGRARRTFTTSKCWDATGNLVTHMSQTSILRPHRLQHL